MVLLFYNHIPLNQPSNPPPKQSCKQTGPGTCGGGDGDNDGDDDAAGAAERAALAALHGEVRKRRHGSTMQLRLPLSLPPDASEMKALHEAHRRYGERL